MGSSCGAKIICSFGNGYVVGEYLCLNQPFVDLFAHKKRRTISDTYTSVIERKEFNFESKVSLNQEGYTQVPEDIQVDEEGADTIDLLARDLKVTPYPKPH